MFSRTQRIRKSEEIITLLRQGRRINEGPLSFFFEGKNASIARVTVVISTKVSKRATERNLVKRRIRAILHQEGLPSGDIIIRGNPGVQKLTFEELRDFLVKGLSKLKSNG